MALDTTIGGVNADSYGTLADYEGYALGMGYTLAATDAANEINMRKAASYLDRKNQFIGMQQYQFQARSFPRLITTLWIAGRSILTQSRWTSNTRNLKCRLSCKAALIRLPRLRLARQAKASRSGRSQSRAITCQHQRPALLRLKGCCAVTFVAAWAWLTWCAVNGYNSQQGHGRV